MNRTNQLLVVASAPHALPALLVDEPEAGRLLGGVCVKTMYNLRRSGELVGIKVGGRTMYEVAGLQRFIDRQKEAANG